MICVVCFQLVLGSSSRQRNEVGGQEEDLREFLEHNMLLITVRTMQCIV